ncbi:hypothetical protein ABT369_34820 [Dactylosporangium sp. NPDC000244]|uniref:hypothetical protein n=1 Tax=Dactylosporangium sp. NPDC000244 TaxID=3154365 RepID=UPI00331AB350
MGDPSRTSTHVATPVDLTPLAGRKLLVVLARRQEVRGVEDLGPGITVKRVPD